MTKASSGKPESAAGPSPDEIRRAILGNISAGILQPGDRLGSERVLALEYGVSRTAIRVALDELERAAVVRRIPGRGGGTFVTGSKIERDLSRVLGVPALLRQQGLTAGTQVVGTGVVAADAQTAAALRLRAGDLVFEIVRIRLAEGKPISLDHAAFPAVRFPGLLEQSLGGSLYELLADRYGVSPSECIERIEVELAAADEATVLDTDEGAPLLSIIRTANDQDGVPFEYSHDLFRADRIRILVRTPGSGTIGPQVAGDRQQIELHATPD